MGCAADLPMGLPDNVRPRAPFAAALVGSRSSRRYIYAGGGGRMSIRRGAAFYAVDAAAAVSAHHLKSRSLDKLHMKVVHETPRRDKKDGNRAYRYRHDDAMKRTMPRSPRRRP